MLTAAGLVAIENIRAGDAVISTNPDTLDTAEKTVLETYVCQVDKLVHLTINGEKIVTTVDHPFYVQNRGFINAGNLLVGDTLISVNGKDLVIEKFFIEETEEPVDVYNFQVEDYHTYFVGECNVWVHNDKCKIVKTERGNEKIPEVGSPNSPEWKKAVKELRNAKGKGNNYIAKNAADAERLINEARPDLLQAPQYDTTKKPNYQVHPVDNEYGMPHIKFEDWSGGKYNGFNGHIFWEG